MAKEISLLQSKKLMLELDKVLIFNVGQCVKQNCFITVKKIAHISFQVEKGNKKMKNKICGRSPQLRSDVSLISLFLKWYPHIIAPTLT